MHVDIQYQSSFALATVTLDEGEAIRTVGGSMVGMAANLAMQTEATGGLLNSLEREVFGGETFFLNTFTATTQGETIALAPPLPGAIEVIELTGEPLLVHSGCFLASSVGVEIDITWEGAQGFFGSGDLIMLRATGSGTLIIASYGALRPMDLANGQTYVVNNGHLVAFEEQIEFAVRTVGGLKSTLFSGEGLVVELTGPGRFWMQSRSQDAFLSWLTAHRH